MKPGCLTTTLPSGEGGVVVRPTTSSARGCQGDDRPDGDDARGDEKRVRALLAAGGGLAAGRAVEACLDALATRQRSGEQSEDQRENDSRTHESTPEPLQVERSGACTALCSPLKGGVFAMCKTTLQ